MILLVYIYTKWISLYPSITDFSGRFAAKEKSSVLVPIFMHHSPQFLPQ
jgi:hypothetical protein